MRKKCPSIEILGIRVDMISIPEIIQQMEDWIVNADYHNYIVVANADTAVKSKRDQAVRTAVNSSALAIPDGFSLLMMGRAKGHSLRKRSYGPDLTYEFFKTTEKKGYSHFFYGSTNDTLMKLIENIRDKFPETKIAGFYAPPFRPLAKEEDEEIIKSINRCKPSVLWVGIGCPKQEIWMYEHREKLDIPIMLGVGAAFDFLAGAKLQAPRWIRNNGFEWLFRLITEPKRLWRRYLVDGSLFIYYVLIELFLNRSRPVENPSKAD
ncbi:MAG: WecB/TagA/CpsF family glycosyltransferase [Candidatus Omnitrophota bacterium]|jgi:N-acetylglucosaminyldiphosphoundecaprenol N-acetyl-beta-D-mannosaminyltransferase